jgi:hypothetical protein
MLRSRAFYYPLIAVLFFGLAISLMPASPALGSNLPFGVTLQQPNLSPNSLVRYSHTLLVGSGGTPSQNGAALLAARDIISNSQPSAANPYLIKLEPGNYDLGNKSLALLPYLDLEGSGEGTTVISSTIGKENYPLTNGTIMAASNSEVRFLKAANFGSNVYQTPLFVPSGATNTRFSHVTAISSGATGIDEGLYNNGGNIAITDSTISAVTASGQGNSGYGIYNNSGNITIANSTISASQGRIDHTGIYNWMGGTLNITNSTINVSSIQDANAIVDFDGGNVKVSNSTLTATATASSNSFVSGLTTSLQYRTIGGNFNFSGTTITVSGGDQVYGMYIPVVGIVTVTNSTITALGGRPGYGIQKIDLRAGVKVANSQLSGNLAASNGLTVCPASVNGNTFAPLSADCK